MPNKAERTRLAFLARKAYFRLLAGREGVLLERGASSSFMTIQISTGCGGGGACIVHLCSDSFRICKLIERLPLVDPSEEQGRRHFLADFLYDKPWRPRPRGSAIDGGGRQGEERGTPRRNACGDGRETRRTTYKGRHRRAAQKGATRGIPGATGNGRAPLKIQFSLFGVLSSDLTA